jgi:DNA-binding CsgD family transcriptional regulator
MKEKSINKVLNVWESENKILNPINKELHLDIIDQIASLFAMGSYYYYILNFQNMKMEFVHAGIKDILGIKPSQFSLNKLFDLMHPDDLKRMHEKEQIATNFKLNKIPKEDITKYKTVYLMRLRHQDGSYKTILHQAKALNVSNDGKVQQVIGIHTDVTYLKMPIDHKISFISNQRPSYFALETDSSIQLTENSFKSTFSIREKEIIKLIAQGKKSREIAAILFISVHTVNTHKKNVLKKSACKNTIELISKCLTEGII